MRGALAVLAPLRTAPQARAEGEAAGDFDCYLMALSWSAGWCALEGDAREDPQCETGRGLTFTLRDPSRGESEAMVDIMGGSGLAWYQ